MSAHINGIWRLPNGNTLVNPAETNHLIEVTSGFTGSASFDVDTNEPLDGGTPQIAWEYIWPTSSTQYALNNASGGSWMFRAYRYDINHPGLRNHLQMSSDYVISLKSNETPQNGYGKTFTGRTPCRMVPCTY
jgi:hypothetical protein